MDLLAGYASDGGSEEADEAAPHENGARAARSIAEPPRASTARAAPATAAGPQGQPTQANLLSKLPAPSSSRVPLFSGLPQPKAAVKKPVVQFRVPITYGDAPAHVEDEVPAKKKQKSSTRGLSLSELLPPPKNSGPSRLDLGAGAQQGTAAGAQAGNRYDSDDDELVPGTEDRTGMDLGPGDANEPEDNEAYRVEPAPADTAAAGYDGRGYDQQQPQHPHYDYGQQQQPQQAYSSYAYQQQQHSAAAAAALDPGQALLDAALAAEREKAMRRGGTDPLAAGGLQFKEVKADAIRYMDPSQRAEAGGVRAALGADYEAKLRSEAGPAVPNRLAKRKHQIGSLYAQAKAQELEDFERRAAGMKTKAETQAKYGW